MSRPISSRPTMPGRLLSTAAVVLLLAISGCSNTAPVATAQPTLEQQGDRYVATRTETLNAESGGTLNLEGRSGGISLETWDRNEVRVQETIELRGFDREEAEQYLRENATRYESAGSEVRVRAPERGGRGWGDRQVARTFDVQLPERFSATVRTSGGSISAEGMNGDLDARTAGGSIEVEGITGTVDIKTAGGSLSIQSIGGAVTGETAGGSIRAEEVGGRLTVRTAGGEIQIAEVGGAVSAETAGGQIEVENVQGSLRARTMGGDIEVTGSRYEIDIATSGGDIELEDIGGPVRARTSGGDIEGRGIRGAATLETSAGDIELQGVRSGVEARTSVGDVEVEMSPDAEGDYGASLTTSHGDILLVLPEGIAAEIDAEAESFYGRVDREDIYSDFPLTRQEREGGSTLRAQGSLNGGGPTLRLRTKGGSIRIEKGS